MMISENVRMGVASVRKARFRSFFTMLGIMIGVVSVITIVSLGEGVKQQIAGQVSDLGDNLLSVRPGKLVNRDDSGEIKGINLFGGISSGALTEADLKTVTALPNVEAATAFSAISGVPTAEGRTMQEAAIIATNSNLSSVVSQEIEFGNFFSDDTGSKKVAVIGPGVAEKLFREAVPIGKSIKIRDQEFVVQGVFGVFETSIVSAGVDFNNAIFIPSSFTKALAGTELPYYEILVKPDSKEHAVAIARAITDSVRANHAGQEDFTVLREDEAATATGNVLQLLTKMIVGMAGITLLVGGIGIMNVMLVSVSERTREIGIRKAIGATNRQIRSQFMIEATILSVWGAVLGVVAALALHLMLRIVTDLEPVLTWPPIILATVLSIMIGILSGVIPAVKASRKDPIDSLRPN